MAAGVQPRPPIHLEPWSDADLPLLRRLLGDPAMTAFLGGPEPEAKLAERQERYARPGSGQFKIVEDAGGADGGSGGAGWVGYWEADWHGDAVYEVGWAVVPEAQGRGYAQAATRRLIDVIRRDGDRRFVHAYPSVENGPSNAICRRLGFTLLEAREFEYPKGHWMLCNDWQLDLEQESGGR